MNKVVRRTCITVRRVARHPVVSRTLRSENLLRRHLVRGATLGIVPSTINDVAFHHAQMNLGEIIHVTQDTVTISTIDTIAAILMLTTKLL
jgi:hypothetical protein